MAEWWETAPTAQEYASGQITPVAQPPLQAGDKWWEKLPTAAQYASGEAAGPPPPEPGSPEAMAAEVKEPSFWEQVSSAVTGRGRRIEGVPELPENLARDGKLTRTMYVLSLARDNPKAMLNLAKKNLPGAEFKTDQWGNLMVWLPAEYQTMENQMVNGMNQPVPKPFGEERLFYLNKPGMSAGDIAQYGPEIAGLGLGAGIGGVAGKAILGTAGRIAGTAIGAGAASLAEDAAGAAGGTGTGLDVMRAGKDSLITAGTEGVGSIVGPLYRAFRGSEALFDATTGKLTPAGIAKLKAQGLDPEAVGQEFSRIFAEQASRGANPTEATAYAGAQSLPTPVRLSKGDLTRDVSQQGFEDAALKGAYGERAKNEMTAMRAEQQDQLRANVGQIGSRLSGGQSLAPGEGATNAMMATQKSAKQLRRAVDSAYESAKTIGNAGLNADHVGATASNMVETIGADFDIAALPKTQKAINDLNEIATKGGPIDIKALENWRTRVVNAGRGDFGPEGVALTRVKKSYDEMIQEALDHDLMTGDPATIAQWQQARALRKDFGDMFESNKIIERMVRNKVEPDQAVNYLFGAGRLGYAKQSAEAAAQLKKILGADNPAWKGLKEEAFTRMMRDAQGPLDANLVPTINGTAFAKNLNDAMIQSPTLMRTLFDKEELGLLQQFKETALRATNRVPGAVNSSGTAYALSRIVQNMFGAGGTAMQALYGRALKPLVGDYRTIQAARGVPEAMPLIPPGVAGALGATAASQRPQQ